MAKNNDTTTRFNADISELKAAFQEASRQIRLANSEFKAASSGMEDWNKSADGVTAKISQLDKVLDAQEKQLKSLNDQYELTVKEYGENSAAAENLKIKINNQQAAINATQQQINSYNQQLENMQSQAQKSESAAEKLRDEIKNQEKNLSDLKDKYASVVLEQGRESDEAKALANQINNLSDNLNDNRNKLENAESAADEFDNTLSDMNETSDKSNDFFSSMKESLTNLVTQGLQLAIDKVKEFATEAINVGKDFDSAMSKVKATSGASAEDMNLLRDKAKEMGSETKFSATESAEALNYMAMAGWKTNDMLDGISGIMNLAAASGEELALTSDIVTDALTALGMSANESGHFADVLASASSNANTNVSLMGESFKYVAPVAGAMGASAEDLAIALGLMANSGIKGSQSGNSLKNSLVNLIRPTAQQAQAMANLGLATIQTRQVFDDDTIAKAQTKLENKTLDLEKAQLKYNESISKYGIESSQAQQALINVEKAENNLADAERDLATARQGTTEVMGVGQSVFTDEYGNMKSLSEIINILRDTFKAVNVDLTDAEGNMRDYDDIINELSQTEEGLTQAEQLKNAGIIFGKQNLAGMLAIINSTKEDYDKLSDAIYNCDGKAKEMAETMSDNLGGDMTKFQSQLETLKIAFYEKFVDSLREGVKSLGKLIDAGYWILDHGTEISAVIAGIAAAFVAFKAVTFIQAAITAFKALALVIQTVGAKQAILNVIMAANPIGLIVAAIAGLVTAFAILWNKSESFRNFWISLWEGIKIVVSYFADFFVNLWNNLTLTLIAVIAYFISLWDGFKDSVVLVWQMIGDFFVNLWNNLKLTLIAVIAYFISLWDGFKDSVVLVWQMIGDFFVNLWDDFQQIFQDGMDIIVGFFKDSWNNLKLIFISVIAYFISLWDGFKDSIISGWQIIADFFIGVWENFKSGWNAVGEFFKTIWDGFTGAIQTVWNAVSNFFVTSWETLKSGWSAVGEFLKTVWNGFTGAIQTIWTVVSDFFINAWESLKNSWSAVGEFFKTVWNSFTGAIQTVWTAVSDFFINAWESLKNSWSAVGEFFKTVWNGFTDSIVSGWQTIADFFANAWENFTTGVSETWESIKSILEIVSDWFNETIIIPVSTFFSSMWDNLVTGAVLAWEGIKTVFSVIVEWFSTKFTEAWTAVKNVFSVGGKIFDGIKEGITSAFTTVVNAIIRGINRVVAFPFNAINNVLDRLRNLSIMDIQPFSWISDISVPKIPELREGGVLRKGKMGFLEGDGDEAVVPLEKNTRWIDEVSARISRNINTPNQYNSSVDSHAVTNNFYQTNNSPKALSRLEIYRQSKNLMKTLG